VTERWLGGTLTNFQTIKKQIKRLKELEQGTAEGEFENYTKKEQLLFDRERVKLDKYLSRHQEHERLPGALFIVDSKKGAHRGRRGEQARDSGGRHRGHERGPGADHRADPGNDDAIRAVSADHRGHLRRHLGSAPPPCRCATHQRKAKG